MKKYNKDRFNEIYIQFEALKLQLEKNNYKITKPRNQWIESIIIDFNNLKDGI